MPLNSIPPTTDAAALAAKRAAAEGQCHVDVGFWGGAVPGNEPDRDRAARRRRVRVQVLHWSTRAWPSSRRWTTRELARAARQAAELGALLIVHAEDPASIGRSARCTSRAAPTTPSFLRVPAAGGRDRGHRQGAPDRPGDPARVHILHLSAAAALPLIDAARQDGVPVTVETCPHYLALAAEDIPDGATQYKCCPPIRDRANRDRLWEALGAGVHRLRGVRSLPVPAGAEAAGGR